MFYCMFYFTCDRSLRAASRTGGEVSRWTTGTLAPPSVGLAASALSTRYASWTIRPNKSYTEWLRTVKDSSVQSACWRLSTADCQHAIGSPHPGLLSLLP